MVALQAEMPAPILGNGRGCLLRLIVITASAALPLFQSTNLKVSDPLVQSRFGFNSQEVRKVG